MTGFIYDPHESMSEALTEVRTVCSRSRTALELLEQGATKLTVVHGRWDYVDGKGVWIPPEQIEHPDADDMIAILRRTVADLSRWEKRGARRGNSR